jgi:hypothetical protein
MINCINNTTNIVNYTFPMLLSIVPFIDNIGRPLRHNYYGDLILAPGCSALVVPTGPARSGVSLDSPCEK